MSHASHHSTHHLLEAPIVLSRGNAGSHQSLALLGDPVQVKQGPEYGDDEWQGDKPKTDQNQSVKRPWAVKFHGESVALACLQ